MTSRRLLILALLAIVVIGAGVWLAGRQSGSAVAESDALYPELKKQLDSVTAVRIVKPGGATAVTIEHGTDGWTVNERSDYPADDAKLRKLLRGIADAKLFEQKTSNAENYATLGVQDIEKTDAGGTYVELVGPAQPVKLIVGKSGMGAQSQYVRRAGEAQSWLIDQSLDTSSSPDQWLRKQVLDIAADRVQSASVSAAKKSYTAAKESRAAADFKVDGIPKGKELSAPSAADGFATALAGLTLSDVRPAAEFTDEPGARATFKTFDGLVAELSGWQRDEKHYVTIKTSFDAAQAERFKVATAPEEKKDGDKPAVEGEGAPPKADQEADKPAEPAKAPNIEEEANTTNAKLTGWAYEIPQYKYEAIFKPLDELLKK